MTKKTKIYLLLSVVIMFVFFFVKTSVLLEIQESTRPPQEPVVIVTKVKEETPVVVEEPVIYTEPEVYVEPIVEEYPTEEPTQEGEKNV